MNLKARKKEWTLGPDAFERLLAFLDDGVESAGESYLEMRRRLVSFFDRKNCVDPDGLADETLSRVARRLEEEGKIETDAPGKYCYIVARFVFMESLRGAAHAPLDDYLRSESAEDSASEDDRDERDRREAMLGCLDKCVAELDAANREIILGYYIGQERAKIDNRRAIASSLGISPNALTIRACRIRDRLEGCVRRCAG